MPARLASSPPAASRPFPSRPVSSRLISSHLAPSLPVAVHLASAGPALPSRPLSSHESGDCFTAPPLRLAASIWAPFTSAEPPRQRGPPILRKLLLIWLRNWPPAQRGSRLWILISSAAPRPPQPPAGAPLASAARLSDQSPPAIVAELQVARRPANWDLGGKCDGSGRISLGASGSAGALSGGARRGEASEFAGGRSASQLARRLFAARLIDERAVCFAPLESGASQPAGRPAGQQ